MNEWKEGAKMTTHCPLNKLRQMSNLPRIPWGRSSMARIPISLLDCASKAFALSLGGAMPSCPSPFLEHPK